MKKVSFLLCFLIISFVGQSQDLDTLIDVGGHRLHFNITKGKGVPILFESGGGDDGSVWNDLRKNLKDSVGPTLITYDRAGTGKSEIDTSKIDILNEIKDLEIALKKLGYLKDIFIVAHSLGGSYSTLFCSRNKTIIKGCVFIDINLPCFMTKQKVREIKAIYTSELPTLKKQKIGIYYLLTNFEKTNDLIRKIAFPASIHATIISSHIPPYKGVDSTQWKFCQKQFGKLPNHTYVLAEKCRHYVFIDYPILVTDEIIKMYRRRTKKN